MLTAQDKRKDGFKNLRDIKFYRGRRTKHRLIPPDQSTIANNPYPQALEKRSLTLAPGAHPLLGGWGFFFTLMISVQEPGSWSDNLQNCHLPWARERESSCLRASSYEVLPICAPVISIPIVLAKVSHGATFKLRGGGAGK